MSQKDSQQIVHEEFVRPSGSSVYRYGPPSWFHTYPEGGCRGKLDTYQRWPPATQIARSPRSNGKRGGLSTVYSSETKNIYTAEVLIKIEVASRVSKKVTDCSNRSFYSPSSRESGDLHSLKISTFQFPKMRFPASWALN